MKRLQSIPCIILAVLLLAIAACSRPMVIRELESKAALVVSSQPEDAPVYVDGQMVGTTPCTAMIDTGVHGRRDVMVAVSKEGYRTKQANVSLFAGKQMKWTNIHLDRMTTLEVDSEPEGASVYVDGELVGETPCMVEVDAEARGRRKVIVAVLKEGYETRRAEVLLAAGKKLKWTDIRLDKLTTPPASPTMVIDIRPRRDAPIIIGMDAAEMVLIPAGQFLMGSPEGEGGDDDCRQHPQHKVFLDAFYIDK